MGKVVGSSKDFPYTEVRTSVQMDDPKESDDVGMQIRYNEQRLNQAVKTQTDIEKYIAGISDSTVRMIFEMTFLEGKKQREVGDELGYTKGRISQIISAQLKD